MTEVRMKNTEGSSSLRRANELKELVTEEQPDKLLNFVDSIQQILKGRLNKIEHKIEAKMSIQGSELNFEKYQETNTTSSLSELKTSFDQAVLPTFLGNSTMNTVNRAR